MAKTETKAAEKKEAGKPKKAFKKRGEKRVVHHGLVTVQASFNNTIITIADAEGNVIAWSSAGAVGFKGSRKGTPFAATQAALVRGQRGQGHGHARLRGAREGPRGRPRVGDPGARDGGDRGQVDPRRHADSAQRLPADQAPARVVTTEL